MKFANLVLLLTIFVAGVANANPRNNSLKDLSADVSELVNNYSDMLDARDKAAVRSYLQEVKLIFRDNGIVENVQSKKLICLSNGETSPVWERFTLYDRNTNKKIGVASSRASCESAIQNMNAKGFTCLSNGETSDVWEKFTLYDSRNDKKIGVASPKDSCALSASVMTREGLTCLSNGETSDVWERFTLYDTRTDKKIGNATSKESCVAALR